MTDSMEPTLTRKTVETMQSTVETNLPAHYTQSGDMVTTGSSLEADAPVITLRSGEIVEPISHQTAILNTESGPQVELMMVMISSTLETTQTLDKRCMASARVETTSSLVVWVTLSNTCMEVVVMTSFGPTTQGNSMTALD